MTTQSEKKENFMDILKDNNIQRESAFYTSIYDAFKANDDHFLVGYILN
jgi:hypothetical protein